VINQACQHSTKTGQLQQHSAEFKARVAMTALSGEKTLAELSAEFGVHPTMISGWKQSW
jgi:transposase